MTTVACLPNSKHTVKLAAELVCLLEVLGMGVIGKRELLEMGVKSLLLVRKEGE